jgi:probable DNA metabolism protein
MGDALRGVAAAGALLLPPGFARWRTKARALLASGVHPGQAVWEERQLHFQEPLPRDTTSAPAPAAESKVPRAFMQLALWVGCHRDMERWALLYRLLWRIAHGERELLQVATDPDVHRALTLAKTARRAAHKMKAFVRFRRALTAADAEESKVRYIAWFEPAHHVVERVTPFFTGRFAGMRWSILTPERCVHWDGVEATFTAGVSPEAAIRVDAFEDLWREYYSSIFNPARLAPGAMRAEMPMSYWKNLPEAQVISSLSRAAPGRVADMIARAEQPPMPIPEEYDMPGATASPPRMRATVTPFGRARRSGLDLPSWDPVLDPGPDVARMRAEALQPTSGRAVQCGDVRVLPGVAGWTDPSLLAPGVFYPDDVVTPEDRLRFYASRYAMVEVDSTYYALPRREHAVAWVQRTPADFVFNVKAHALMTGHGADLRRLPDWLRRDARAQAEVRGASAAR